MDTDRVRLCVYRLLQLFSTCAAFSLVASLGTGMGAVSHWSMFIWCFCFVITLITFIVQLGEYQPSLPFSGKSFLFTYACLATVFCLSASIMYAITYIQFLPRGPFWDQATAFSWIACVLYALEGAFLWLLFLGETTSILLPFMACSSCWRHRWPASSSPSSATPTCTSTSRPWCGAWPCTPSASRWGPWPCC